MCLYLQKQDVTTRWGSTLNMIKSLLVNRASLDILLTSDDHKHYLCLLSDSEWTRLSSIAEVLEPVEIATTFLGGEKYASLSTVLPVLAHLKRGMKVTDDDSAVVSKFKNQFETDLQLRMDGLEADASLKLATILDPRFKRLKSVSRSERESVFRLLKNLAKDIAENATIDLNSQQPQKKRKSDSQSILLYDEGSSDDEDSDVIDAVSAEINAYKQVTQIQQDECPLEWWGNHAATFPYLAELASKYLCIPATSVPCRLHHI